MRKVILVPALLGVMGIGGIIAVAGGNIVGSADSPKKLSASEIEKKALAEVNGTITDFEFEREGTRSYYEVEIITSDAEYDLKFDAFTGELLKKRKERLEKDDIIKASYKQVLINNTTDASLNDNRDDSTSAKNSTVSQTSKATAGNENTSQKSSATTSTTQKSVVQPRFDDDYYYDDDRYDDLDDLYDDRYDDDRYDDDDDDDFDDRYDDDDDDDDDDRYDD
ncbi:PepSY domain-containing protein [Lysinibacillus telephonicus]|uniref:PepSY domain-containing protein n=1 Tax=Lysinibacillus telephonicus TaxID=1714840 RepID=A0A3S0HLX5_9BACI|nr:PepSY domain-containing protein [Lysinibacillus telephonicus]RTQ93641.1 hypothetical protein EKG35_07745 [Lysinibacillus telephonicus]